VIDLLITLGAQYECVFIRGNHDTWCEGWLRGEESPRVWLLSGGAATIESYSRISEAQREKHLDFFSRMHNYYIDEANRLYIHAGFSSMRGPAHERYETNYSWDRTLWEMARTMDNRIKKDSKLYPKRLLLFHEIFIGHTPTLEYDCDSPMHACNVWNLDTGAAYYGKLSAMDVDTRRYLQSDMVQELYPTEKGRN
jgi:serine/threonine protein phosphatase 1